ncbi:MAG TPA: trypsin-like peptidase domain-containing protein [Planctomycetaceae bacterium]|nr:trypsin-like peptidase domain-containing protein [Planctomycetaceae bacterium]
MPDAQFERKNQTMQSFSSKLGLLISIGIWSFAPSLLPGQDAESVSNFVQPRMVKIFGAGGIKNLHHYSTGFIVTPQGHIATVWSHVLDRDEVTVILSNGRRETARVLGAEPQLDLAVLKIDAAVAELPYFDLKADTGKAGAGTRVLAYSNMFKVATGDEPMSILHGVIAAETRLSARRGAFSVPYDGPVFIVDAITNNPGAGGGILTRYDGKIVAMIGKELRNTESNTWINYAMPIEAITPVIEQIVSGNYVAQKTKPEIEDNPRRYRPLDFGLVMIPDVVYRTPTFVDRVVPGSLAEELEIRPGDLILFVNDTLVQSLKELDRELGILEATDDLRIVLRRDNNLVTVETIVPRK